jgi:hypothetical protein
VINLSEAVEVLTGQSYPEGARDGRQAVQIKTDADGNFLRYLNDGTYRYRQPEGDGQLRSSYFHMAVCMLEWQAMEELTDASRARSVIEWKQRDRYKAVYAILLQHRDSVEAVLHRHGVQW